MTTSIEDRLQALESRATEAEARLAELSVLPEIVLLVHECIIDIADTIEELAGQAPDGLNGGSSDSNNSATRSSSPRVDAASGGFWRYSNGSPAREQ